MTLTASRRPCQGRSLTRRWRGGTTLLLTTALGLSIGLSIPARAQTAGIAAPTHVEIPAQPLDAAIRALIRVTGLQIAYPAPLSEGKRSGTVSGNYTAPEALSRLLTGTGLGYRFTSANTVTLEKPPTGDNTLGLVLPPVSVEGQTAAETAYGAGQGFVAHQSATATKSDTPIVEIPQAISVVTRSQMDDQNVQSVRQALRYTSGIMPERNGLNGDAYEQIYGRGFQLEEYLDGLRLPNNAYNTLAIEPYDLERVEVLHGPASVLYGQAYPGGLVNLVSKRPTSDPLHEIYLQAGSPGQVSGGFDLSGPLDEGGQFLYRLTGSAKDADTQVSGVKQERVSLAPSFTWRPDGDTTFTILGRYQYDPQAGYYNNLPAAGTVLPNPNGKIPTKFNPGDPGFDKYSRTEESIGYLLDHRFDDVWSIHQSLRYTHDNANIENVFANGLESDQKTLSRYSFFNKTSLDQLTVDTNGQAAFSTGPLHHTITAGVDYQRIAYKEQYGFNYNVPTLNILAPVYNQAIAFPTSSTIDTEVENQFGLYAQDQIRLGHWSFLVGGREDWADSSGHSETDGSSQSQFDRKFTWRAGAVYLFDNGISPYVSYATSFQPTTGTSFSGTNFKPTTGQQYEVGVKYQPTGFNSFITASAFNLTQQNVLTVDPVHTQFQSQTGEIRSRGIELEAHASLTNNLNVVAAYTYLDNVVTKSNTTTGAYTSNAGETPSGIPSNVASAWASYMIPSGAAAGLRLGGGVRYISATFGDNADSFKIPAYTLFDAAVHYDLGHARNDLAGWQIEANATNIFDKTYIAGCTSSAACTYGLRRTVLASLKYQW